MDQEIPELPETPKIKEEELNELKKRLDILQDNVDFFSHGINFNIAVYRLLTEILKDVKYIKERLDGKN